MCAQENQGTHLRDSDQLGPLLRYIIKLKGHFTPIKLFSLTFVEVGVVFTKSNTKCVKKCLIFSLFIELNSKI